MRAVERVIERPMPIYRVKCKKAIGRHEKDEDYEVYFLKLFTGKLAMFTVIDGFERDGRHVVFEDKNEIAEHFDKLDYKQNIVTIKEK